MASIDYLDRNEPPLVSNISSDERYMGHVAAGGDKSESHIVWDNPAILEHVNKKTGHRGWALQGIKMMDVISIKALSYFVTPVDEFKKM